MSLRRRSPRPLATALQTMRGRWQPESETSRAQTAWARAQRAWAEVIGEHGAYVLERARPVSVRHGVLTVRCSEAAVAQTLELQAQAVLARLNEQIGEPGLTALRCVTGNLDTGSHF